MLQAAGPGSERTPPAPPGGRAALTRRGEIPQLLEKCASPLTPPRKKTFGDLPPARKLCLGGLLGWRLTCGEGGLPFLQRVRPRARRGWGGGAASPPALSPRSREGEGGKDTHLPANGKLKSWGSNTHI